MGPLLVDTLLKGLMTAHACPVAAAAGAEARIPAPPPTCTPREPISEPGTGELGQRGTNGRRSPSYARRRDWRMRA